MVPETLDSVLKPLQRAMGICGHLGSSSHARKNIIPALFDELRDDLRNIIRETPAVTLVIDGGDAKFGDGRTGKMSVYNIYAESAYWEEPLLLETIIVRHDPKDGGCDGKEIASMLTGVMDEYSLKLFDSRKPDADGPRVIGVATDNAQVMKKAARLAKLPRIACGSHVGNLIVGCILDELQLLPLLDLLNTIFSVAAGLDDMAARAGFTAGRLRTASYKFSFAQLAIQELLEKYDDIRDFVASDENLPRGVADVFRKEAKAAAAAAKGAKGAPAKATGAQPSVQGTVAGKGKNKGKAAAAATGEAVGQRKRKSAAMAEGEDEDDTGGDSEEDMPAAAAAKKRKTDAAAPADEGEKHVRER
jgi:hypothetical protein